MSKSTRQIFKELRGPSMDSAKFRKLCAENNVNVNMADNIYDHSSLKRKILEMSGRTVLYARGGTVEYISEASDRKIGEVFRKDYNFVYEQIGQEKGHPSSSESGDVGKLVSQEEAKRLFEAMRKAVE